MIYKEFKGLSLSALGMGCMRLPMTESENPVIDEAEVARMVEFAMQNGVNYFDTAWGYHSGQSEPVIGRALKNYPRGSFYLATKFPGFDRANMARADEIFRQQLERCQVDYFDFYLIHNVCESNIDGYLDEEQYGLMAYFAEQKRLGRIKHLGCSFHGQEDTMRRFLDAWEGHIEFAQIQLNYLDWTLQDAAGKVRMLNERNIPIWVMEPLRGGRLAELDEESTALLRTLRPEETVPAWAFRFLQTVPGVVMTLSGMSNLEQTKANVATFCEEKPLNPEEWDGLLGQVKSLTAASSLPCTACNYCVDYCPMGLSIPKFIRLYNELSYLKRSFTATMVVANLPEEKRPTACIGCRACEEVCPQSIKISEMMPDFAKKLEEAKD